MRHLKKRKKLSRPAAHRDALMANLCKFLIRYGRIKTTKAKAKMVQPFIEKMVTRSKNNNLHSKRIVASRLKSWESIPKLFDQIGPKFKSRAGGYTRIIKLGFRNSDGAEIVLLEFLEKFSDLKEKQKEEETKKSEVEKKAKEKVEEKIKQKK